MLDRLALGWALQQESLKGTAGVFIEKEIFALAKDGKVTLFGLKEGQPVESKAELNPAYVMWIVAWGGRNAGIMVSQFFWS